jgi:hypothetical protein
MGSIATHKIRLTLDQTRCYPFDSTKGEVSESNVLGQED